MNLLKASHWYDTVMDIVAMGHRETVRDCHTGLEADGKAGLDKSSGAGVEAG